MPENACERRNPDQYRQALRLGDGRSPDVDGESPKAASRPCWALRAAARPPTLRMIAGLIDPSEGDIEIKGRRVNDIPIHKRNLGLVFQNYALFPHKTVAENVAFGLKYRGVSRERMRGKRCAGHSISCSFRRSATAIPRPFPAASSSAIALARRHCHRTRRTASRRAAVCARRKTCAKTCAWS